jgi:hypothetical protein
LVAEGCRDWATVPVAVPLRDLHRRLGKDVRDELVREPVDLALVDSMSLAAIRAAERAGVPTAVLMHTFHRYHTHEWSRGPIGVVAAMRGMRPGRLWNAADRVLVATATPFSTRRRDGSYR